MIGIYNYVTFVFCIIPVDAQLRQNTTLSQDRYVKHFLPGFFGHCFFLFIKMRGEIAKMSFKFNVLNHGFKSANKDDLRLRKK